MQEQTQSNSDSLFGEQLNQFFFILLVSYELYNIYSYLAEKRFNFSQIASDFQLIQNTRRILSELYNNVQSIIHFLVYIPNGALAYLFFQDVFTYLRNRLSISEKQANPGNNNIEPVFSAPHMLLGFTILFIGNYYLRYLVRDLNQFNDFLSHHQYEPMRVMQILYQRWAEASQREELEDLVRNPHWHELAERLFGAEEEEEIEENNALFQNQFHHYGPAMSQFGLYAVQHPNAQQRLNDYINQIDEDESESIVSIRYLYN